MDSNKQIETMDRAFKDGSQQGFITGRSSQQRCREGIHNHSYPHHGTDPIERPFTIPGGRSRGVDPHNEPHKALLGHQIPTLSIKVPFEPRPPNDIECSTKEQMLEAPEDDSDSQSSICVSPTWPVPADKEMKQKRRLEKERQGAQKRLDKVERRLQKVEEKRRLDEDKRDRSSVEVSTQAAKSRRPSFSLPRLSFSHGVPQVQNEKKSRRLSKSNPADYLPSASTERRASMPERRPSIMLPKSSRRGAPWAQSQPSFQFLTLARLNGSRGKEVVDNQPSSSTTGSGLHPNEAVKSSRDATPPSEHNPKEGGPSTQAGTFPSIKRPENSKFPLLAVSSKNTQRKLARKAALSAQSPRQLYSKDSSYHQTNHESSSINARHDAPQAASLHVHNLTMSTSVNSNPARNQPTACSHPREVGPHGVKSEKYDQGTEHVVQIQQYGNPDEGLKEPQGPIGHVQRPVDQRAAQILAWNEQVAAEGPSAVVNQDPTPQSATIYHRRKLRHHSEEAGDGTRPVDIGNQAATPSLIPMPDERGFQSFEQNSRNPPSGSSLLMDISDKGKSVDVTAEKMSNLTTSETNIPDEAISQPIHPLPWTWTSPFRSLWRTSRAASFNTSSSSRHSTSSQTPAGNTDIVLVSSNKVPEAQRSRCSSTTIKPQVYDEQIRVEPETLIMNAAQNQLSNTNHGILQQCIPQSAEVTAAHSQLLLTEAAFDDVEEDRWSQIVNWEQATSEKNATSIEWKASELRSKEEPHEPQGTQDESSQIATHGQIASGNLSRGVRYEASGPALQAKAETLQATGTFVQKNAAAAPSTSAAAAPSISYTDLTKPNFPLTIRDYQEKFSISDGSESISHLSTKSTSLSSSFDKYSLPLGTSANTYGNHPVSTNRRGIRGSAANKPIQPRLAKIFIVCCNCCRWHDPPSLYFREWSAAKLKSNSDSAQRSEDPKKAADEGQINEDHTEKGATKFACYWCNHAMTKQCCASWTSVCSLSQKH